MRPALNSSVRRLSLPFVLLTLVLAVGILWYWLLEGFSLLEADGREGGDRLVDGVVAPPGTTVLRDGDRLMIYGRRSALDHFATSDRPG